MGHATGQPPGWIRTNQGTAAMMAGGFIVLLIYLWLQEWTHRDLRDGFMLGFFCLIGAGTCLFCALVMMIDSQRRRVEEDMDTLGWIDWALTVVILVLLYVFYELAWTFGFALIAPFFLGAATYIFGARPWWTAALSGVLTTVAISVAFWAIGIDLPLPFFLSFLQP
jgi:hypothetical protein